MGSFSSQAVGAGRKKKVAATRRPRPVGFVEATRCFAAGYSPPVMRSSTEPTRTVTTPWPCEATSSHSSSAPRSPVGSAVGSVPPLTSPLTPPLLLRLPATLPPAPAPRGHLGRKYSNPRPPGRTPGTSCTMREIRDGSVCTGSSTCTRVNPTGRGEARKMAIRPQHARQGSSGRDRRTRRVEAAVRRLAAWLSKPPYGG